MSTFENPDAAPGTDGTPETTDGTPETADGQAAALPPVPETPAAEAAGAIDTTRLDELTPPVAIDSNETSALPDLAPPPAVDSGETPGLADLEPPNLAPAALPPAFTGFPPAPETPSAAVAPDAIDAARATASAIPSGPRTRWAGIVWGLVLAAIAAGGLWLLTDAGRHAEFTAWILSLTPAAAIAYSVLVIGAFALVAGLVGLVRRAQRAGERRRAASALAP